ncbi:ER membrane protein complex subunit 10 [Amyelois transitella]|uniref:ER membrane protein complex subunit 10 n=1 Tax=Amyelois transitella TaxID=680683 RepID=UPI002990536C|nr:ER membrane protein complex subunit 10 [Amyelois transitella]
MKTIIKFAYFFKILQFVVGIDYDGWLNIKIEHKLNCEEDYCTRGNIALKSIRTGTSVIEQKPFTKQHIEELKEIADYDGFYTIRTLVTSAENKETEFLSSVKARAFLESGLSDVINAWVLPNGAVTVVSFQVANISRTLQYETNERYAVNSNFYLRYVDQAPVPDTTSYIQKLEREREAREKGDLKDNRSFLAKYWMYIVPIAIFVMISGATNPEPAAQASR